MNLTKRIQNLSHLELLLTLVLTLVVQSFLAPDGLLSRTIFNLLLLGIVLSAIRSLSESRGRLSLAVVISAVAYTLSWLAELRSSTGLVAMMMACYSAVFTILAVSLYDSVFRAGPVDANRIIGAVSIYIVLGLIWAFVYSLLETVQPGSFRFADEVSTDGVFHDKVGDLIYFSNVTLTTLGYGDIAPISRPAKMFASLEGIVGQLYVAIIIGRMVGLQISNQR